MEKPHKHKQLESAHTAPFSGKKGPYIVNHQANLPCSEGHHPHLAQASDTGAAGWEQSTADNRCAAPDDARATRSTPIVPLAPTSLES